MLGQCGLKQFRCVLRAYYKRNLCATSMSMEATDEFAGGGGGNTLVFNNEFTAIKEGKAEVLFCNSRGVFYNPVQEFNRDLSVAILRTFVKEYEAVKGLQGDSSQSKDNDSASKSGIEILEALSASGLRAIRYASEIPGVKRIVANDISSQAAESIRRNVEHNRVQDVVEVSQRDASDIMYEHRLPANRFHVVDLDPYGSPTSFLDPAIQCVADGGMLLVTCTDVAILCGNCSEKCHANYGAMSLKSKFCHEMALRIVLQCIESHANRYGRYIVPMLSVSVDFYVRLFVKVHSGHAVVKQSASKLAMVYMCVGCESFALQPIGRCVPSDSANKFKYSNASGPTVDRHCNHCGGLHHLGGPIWTKAMHDNVFLEKVLSDLEESPSDLRTSERIQGILTLAMEELSDVPLFYTLDKLSSVIHTRCPKINQFRSALLNAGYRVSYSHCRPQSIKTDAPTEFIWDIMRHWAKMNPVQRKLTENEPAKIILSREPRGTVSFDLHANADPISKKANLLRYQMNPEKYWGPKSRGTTGTFAESNSKSIRLQGKYLRQQRTDKTDLQQFPCKRFRKGECSFGNDCKYSHKISETDLINIKP